MLAAASLVVVAAGLAAVVMVQRGGDDPAVDVSPNRSWSIRSTIRRLTTLPTEPSSSVPDSVPIEELGGVRFPSGRRARKVSIGSCRGPTASWRARSMNPPTSTASGPCVPGSPSTVRAAEPIEMTMPPGMNSPGRVTSTGDRFVTADVIYPTEDAEVIRVASTTDLINWSLQDFELPRLPEVEDAEIVARSPSWAAWPRTTTDRVFEVPRLLWRGRRHGRSQRSGPRTYQIRSDDDGFTVLVYGADGSPPTPETTFEYTWAEFGITPDQVPYLTGETPASRTLAATWDGTPAVSETPVPRGPTLASPEGFVRWNDHTWFSPDGVTWTQSPLPDPTGTVQNALPVDGGFVAIVVDQDGTLDLYRLDEQGGNPRQIEVDGVPEAGPAPVSPDRRAQGSRTPLWAQRCWSQATGVPPWRRWSSTSTDTDTWNARGPSR